MKTMIFILSLAFVLIAAFSFIHAVIVRKRKSFLDQFFIGDLPIKPNIISPIRNVNPLLGDIDSYDYDDDDDEEGTGDPLGDITAISNDTNPNDFISGDIDQQLKQSLLTQGDFLEGGIFNKLFKKKAKRATPSQQSQLSKKFINGANKLLANQQTAVQSVNFPANFLALKKQAAILNSSSDLATKEEQLAELKAASLSPGALLSKVDLSRIVVVGGTIKVSETDLKIPGRNLKEGIQLWESLYPGRSRSAAKIADVNGDVVFSPFVDPTGDEITKVMGVFLIFTAPALTKVVNAEITIEVSGYIDTVNIVYSKDRVALFTGADEKVTMITYLPTLTIKNSLYVKPYDAPTVGNPIEITLAGVPTGTNVIARLAGVDSQEWLDYKKMLNLV